MEFRARLGTPGGEIIEGVYVAESEARLRRELEAKGLYVLALHRRGSLAGLTIATPQRRRIRHQEFIVFNQELATLLKAGMPLVQSLDILRQRVANPSFKAVLDGIYEKVKAGTALSDAFGEHGELFPPVYAASLLAGERSGNLDAVIRRYVAYEKVIGAVRKRTIAALIYPGILVTMMVILIGIIVLRVVPAFSEFYSNFNRPLPLSTRIVVAVSHGVVRNISLLGGGIPLVNALEIAGRALGNRYLARELDAVRHRVQEGDSFAHALLERNMVADVAVKMVEVGESTGALQEMLTSLAEFYDEEIETEVTRFITLLEPVLLIVMGVIIAIVVLALYMPLFELSSVVGN